MKMTMMKMMMERQNIYRETAVMILNTVCISYLHSYIFLSLSLSLTDSSNVWSEEEDEGDKETKEAAVFWHK